MRPRPLTSASAPFPRCGRRPGGGRPAASAALVAAWALCVAAAPGRAQEAPDFRLDVGGYGSARLEATDAGDRPTSLTLRRLVLTTDARVGSRVRFYSEIELERFGKIELEKALERAAGGGANLEQALEGTGGSELALEQAWGQVALADGVGLRFGALLPPVGRFNGRHDDNLWDFPRRPLIDRAVAVLPASAAWTEMGLGLVGRSPVGATGELAWELYLLNGTELDFALESKLETRPTGPSSLVVEAAVRPSPGAVDGSARTDAVAGRVAFSPALGTGIGLSGYRGRYAPSVVGAGGAMSTLGLDGSHRVGPLELEGELLYTHYEDLTRVLGDLARVLATREAEAVGAGGELVTEIETEVRGLSDDRYGFWLDAGLPLALPRGFMGFDAPVLTPVVRYERVWLAGDVQGVEFGGGGPVAVRRDDRRQGRLSLGAAYRPVPQAVFQLVYERDDAGGGGGLLDPAVGETGANGVVFGMAVGF